MEHKLKKQYGSYPENNTGQFLSPPQYEDHESHQLDSAIKRAISKSNRSSMASDINDFSILSYNSAEERKRGSNRKSSVSVRNSSESCESDTSSDLGFKDTIEIQMDESLDWNENYCDYIPIVRKLLIIGAKDMWEI